jgi:hypothetical protein
MLIGAGTLNAADWSISQPAGMEQTDQWFQINYDKTVDQTMMLKPGVPIALPENLTRIKLWYANTLGQTEINMVIQDAAGKQHTVPMTHDTHIEPWAVKWDPTMRDDWPLWSKTETIWLGIPDQETLSQRQLANDVKATQKMLWPKPWKLSAIRLTKGKVIWGSNGADRKAIKEGKGSIILGDLKFETQSSFNASSYGKISDLLRWSRNDQMKLFLDDLIKPAGKGGYNGKLEFNIKIRKGYQGPVVWQTQGHDVLDRTQPLQLMNQAIKLPLLPVGKYFIQTYASSEDGKHDDSRLFQWFIGEGPDTQLQPVEENFRIETGQPNHVFDYKTTQATLTIKHEHPENVRLFGIHIHDFTGKEIYSKKISGKFLKPIIVDVEPGCDYFVAVNATDATPPHKVTDVALLHFGVANVPQPKRDIPVMPNVDQLLKGRNQPHVEYWTRQHAQQRYPWYSNIDMEDMEKWADHVKTFGWDILAIRTIWPDMEMLPGVTRFKQLDQLMDVARRNGQKVMVGCSIWGDRGEAVWMDWKPQRDQHGNYSSKVGTASPYDPLSMQGKNKFWENLANHFNADPDMVGYHILGAGLSGDADPEETRKGYSKTTEQAFEQWLKQQGKPSMPMPQPLIVPMHRAADLGPDLSDAWLNMTEFLADTNVETVASFMKAIRKVDKQRPILVDRKPFPWAPERLVSLLHADGNATLKNEGSPRFGDVMLRTMSVQAGVPYLGELHRHIPSSLALTDVINFWETLWADHAFWIQRWRYKQFQEQWASGTDLLRNEVPQVLDFMKKTQHNWDTFIKAPYDVPQVLVFASRASENLGGARRGFFDDLAGIRTFAALYRQHQVPVFAASEYTEWVDLNKFKMVFVEGEILTPHAVERLTSFANTGGKLVFVGQVGKYIAGNFSEHDDLYTQLKHLPNVRRIDDPARIDIDGVRDWSAPYAFDSKTIEQLLAWASVKRPATVLSDANPAFEVATRRDADGNRVYIGVMRSWYGWYRDRIEKQDVLRKLFGMAKGTVTVYDLPNGKWHVRKFHREAKDLGIITVTNGQLQFETDDAEGGESLLYELVRQ